MLTWLMMKIAACDAGQDPHQRAHADLLEVHRSPSLTACQLTKCLTLDMIKNSEPYNNLPIV